MTEQHAACPPYPWEPFNPIRAWNAFWGIFVYVTGDAILSLDLVHVVVAFIVWSGLVLGKVFILDRRFNASTHV